MQFKSLGATKLKVSALGLTLENKLIFSSLETNLIEHLQHLLHSEINFFDTFQNDEQMEQFFCKTFSDRWNKIVLAANISLKKFINLKEEIKFACEKSLKNLCVDVIDLYYLNCERHEPIQACMEGLVDLIAEGKIRYIGLAQVDLVTLQTAHEIYPISAIKNNFSHFTPEMTKFCEEQHISLILNPLSSQDTISPQIHQLATHSNLSDEQLISLGLMSKPFIIPLIKIKDEHDLQEIAQLKNFILPKEILNQMEELIAI